jgi:hypothetical protein
MTKWPDCPGTVVYKIFVDGVESTADWLGINILTNTLLLEPEKLKQKMYDIKIETFMETRHY